MIGLRAQGIQSMRKLAMPYHKMVLAEHDVIAAMKSLD